ncbi:MAG: GIY-YIG nuclease family protein [Victivallales bacterium]
MEIRVGALGSLLFRKGFYSYTGSAMGGLEARIKRHLRKDKRLHWHIDYLLGKAEIIRVLAMETNIKSEECMAAARLEKSGGIPVGGFGCSDCKCKSHLFHFKSPSMMKIDNYRLLKL